jgi:hypothetical protein
MMGFGPIAADEGVFLCSLSAGARTGQFAQKGLKPWRSAGQSKSDLVSGNDAAEDGRPPSLGD